MGGRCCCNGGSWLLLLRLAQHHRAWVKKTTHLNGAPGAYKRARYWAQAALCGAGSVVVGRTGHRDTA
eukprot:gene50257-41982_t